MSVDRKEIDLIIRAAVSGQNNLPAVTKSIADLEKAITSQAAAAKRGEISIDELKSTLLALQQAQDKLKDQAGLIGQFQKLAEQVSKTTEKAEKAAKTQSEFQAKLDASGKVTETQTERLNKYAAATERTQQAVGRQKDQQSSLQKVLQQSGIDVGNLATAETTLRTSAAQLGLAINKSQQAIANYATDVRAARDAEKQFAETKAFEKQASDAAKLVKAAEYVNFWENALHKADTAQKEFATNTNLRKIADDAVAASRGYLTLGRAISTISAPGPSLGNVIKGIIDPAKQARLTLAGVETELSKVQASVTKIKGPISDYAGKLRELAAIQKSIQGQASLVDDYTSQVSVLRAVRSEFTNARKDVLQYAEALRTSKGDNELLLSSLANAKAKLAGASSAMQQEVIATRSLRDSLREAGISTNNLTKSTGNLVTASKNAVSALSNLNTKYKQHGEAVKQSASALGGFNSSGRTTLSLLQRFKGELLAATSAYVGFYGVIGNGQKVLAAYNTRQEIKSQLAISVGSDAAKITEEYAYIRGQADRLGVSFESLAKGYAKFLASGTLAGRSKNELRVIFESFSEVGRVANLTKENMDGIFRALEQVLSKGSIYAEELNGQLGDRLFGAFQVAANALKKEFPNLHKAMKDGLVTAKEFIRIAEKYREIVADQLPASLKSLAAEQDRLTSSIFDFKLLIADSGFADAFGKFVKKLKDFFESSKGEDFAKNIGKAFTVLSDALIYLLENLDTVIAIGKTIALLYGVKMFANGIAGLIAFRKEAILLFTALRTGSLGAMGPIGALLTVGVVLYTQVKPFRDFVDEFVKGLGEVANAFMLASKEKGIFAGIKAANDAGVAALTPSVSEQRNRAYEDATKRKIEINKQVTSGERVFTSNIGLGELGRVKLTRTEISRLKDEFKVLNAQQKSLMAARDADLAKTNKPKVISATPVATVREGKTTTTTTTTTTKPNVGLSDAQLNKAKEKIESLVNEISGALNTLNDSIDKKVAVTLKERIAAIESNFTNLSTKIAELNRLAPGKGDEFAARLEADKQALILQETKKFNEDLVKEKEALESTLETIEAQAAKKEKDSLELRLAAIVKAQADKYREIQAFRDSLIANNRDTGSADALKSRLDVATEHLKLLETEQFYLDGMASREKAISDLVSERTSRIEALNIQQEAGLLNQNQVWEQSKVIIDELQPKIEALAADSRVFAETIPLAFRPELVAEFSAKISEAELSAKKLKTALFDVNNLSEMLAAGATTAFDNSAKSIGDAIAGTKSWGEAIGDVRDAFLNYAADFLRQIALMMIKQTLLNELQKLGGSGGGFLGTVASALSSAVFHEGGVVSGSLGRSRSVDASMFVGAPRYHKGGIAGLAPDEYPTILQKNEEVLKKSDPRNVLNGGLNKGDQPQANQTTRIINVIDPAMAGEYMKSSAGERVLMNFIGRNKSGIRSALA